MSRRKGGAPRTLRGWRAPRLVKYDGYLSTGNSLESVRAIVAGALEEQQVVVRKMRLAQCPDHGNGERQITRLVRVAPDILEWEVFCWHDCVHYRRLYCRSAASALRQIARLKAYCAARDLPDPIDAPVMGKMEGRSEALDHALKSCLIRAR